MTRYGAIHQAAGLMASLLRLVPFRIEKKNLSMGCEWETGNQNALQGQRLGEWCCKSVVVYIETEKLKLELKRPGCTQ